MRLGLLPLPALALSLPVFVLVAAMLGACDQAGEPDPTPVSSSSGPPDVDPCDALPDVSECLAKSSECSKRCDGCPPGGSICLPDEPDCAHDCAVAEQKCSDRYYECVQGDDSSG